MKLVKTSVVLLSLLINVSVFAASSSPVFIMNNAASQLLTELNKNKSKLKNNPEKVDSIVKNIYGQLFDSSFMAKAVIDPICWNSASKNTQQQFEKEFTTYLIRLYAVSFYNFDGEEIKWLPVRGAVESDVQIQSYMLLKNGQKVEFIYNLKLIKGKWMIIDYSISGISVVKNSKAQFSGMSSDGGLDGLAAKLRKQNEIK